MERLTIDKTIKRHKESAFARERIVDKDDIDRHIIETDKQYVEWLEELKSYREAEEQGLLLRLPFKIGQKVYYIYESCIDKSLMIGSMVYSYSCLDFPREYFSTKEEAVQALKQMGE